MTRMKLAIGVQVCAESDASVVVEEYVQVSPVSWWDVVPHVLFMVLCLVGCVMFVTSGV